MPRTRKITAARLDELARRRPGLRERIAAPSPIPVAAKIISWTWIRAAEWLPIRMPVSGRTTGQQPWVQNVFTCGGCALYWTGRRAAHCGSCHRHFSTVTYFDWHRQAHGEHGVCRAPATVVVGDGSPALVLQDGV